MAGRLRRGTILFGGLPGPGQAGPGEQQNILLSLCGWCAVFQLAARSASLMSTAPQDEADTAAEAALRLSKWVGPEREDIDY